MLENLDGRRMTSVPHREDFDPLLRRLGTPAALILRVSATHTIGGNSVTFVTNSHASSLPGSRTGYAALRQFAFAAIRVNPHGGMKHLPIDVRPDIDRRGHRFGLVR